MFSDIASGWSQVSFALSFMRIELCKCLMDCRSQWAPELCQNFQKDPANSFLCCVDLKVQTYDERWRYTYTVCRHANNWYSKDAFQVCTFLATSRSLFLPLCPLVCVPLCRVSLQSWCGYVGRWLQLHNSIKLIYCLQHSEGWKSLFSFLLAALPAPALKISRLKPLPMQRTHIHPPISAPAVH